MEKYFKDSIGGQTEQRQGNHRQYFYTKGPDQRRKSLVVSQFHIYLIYP